MPLLVCKFRNYEFVPDGKKKINFTISCKGKDLEKVFQNNGFRAIELIK